MRINKNHGQQKLNCIKTQISQTLCITKTNKMKKAILVLTAVLLVCHISFGQSEDFTVYNDLSYLSKESVSNDSLQRLNLVLPSNKENYPLLIWIGGGAWSYGDRNQEMDLAKRFAAQGIAVASIGHRLSPATWRDSTLDKGIQHPRHIEDVAASVKWLHDNADTYGYDKGAFFIGGYSSGAHLSALISLDNTYLNQVGLSIEIFKGVIPISGTYDIVDYHNVFLNGGRPELAKLHVEAVFGSTDKDFKNASPVTYLKNLSIPMLLISDNTLYNYSKLFEEKIRETEFRDMQVLYSYDLSHGELWKNISLSEKSIYRAVIVNFIKTLFGNG
ncbi:alpha/beta hydrolase [Ulvibacterium marinum]|uniref:Alpha/beta hydrolase n=2 Tax=Ulvibacterium marinum TaxID=2419782 RepID=A0A3B0CBI2_9FLAO|nr:alpha/beta hydrolase [Ulvibacterium marinum]